MKVTFRSPKSSAPDREHGIRVPYAAGKRGVTRWRWYLLVLFVSAPLLFLIGKILYTTLIVTAPGLISLERVQVNANIAGWVKSVMVQPGETVAPGHVLATLASQDLEQREKILSAELAARLPAPASPDYAAVMKELATNRKIGQRLVDYYASQLKNVRFLFDQGAATVAELSLAQTQLHQAELNLQQIRSSLESRQIEEARLRLPDKEYEAKTRSVAAELESVEEQKTRLVCNSPVRGKVLEIHVGPGQALWQGQPLISLGNLDSVCILAYLDPQYLHYARAGQQAYVKLEDGRTFSAVVRQNSEMTTRLPAAVSSPLGAREFVLLVTLDPTVPLPSEDLVDNLPVTIRFPLSF